MTRPLRSARRPHQAHPFPLLLPALSHHALWDTRQTQTAFPRSVQVPCYAEFWWTALDCMNRLWTDSELGVAHGRSGRKQAERSCKLDAHILDRE